LNVQDYMRDVDIRAFVDAAKRYRVWILVRASNKEAKPYIGQPGYAPKRLDCKAKAADLDLTIPGLGAKKTAGLVVDLELDNGIMKGAFSPKKLAKAEEAWEHFRNLRYLPEPLSKLLWIPQGKFYTVQRDRSHRHYGCVMFSVSSNIAAGRYIHSDYDLYAIVREDDPATNERVVEERLGQKHSRSRAFFDVQHFLNSRMGVAMILHGEQEKFSADMDDILDVFWPDGRTPTREAGSTKIAEFYRHTLKGRRLFGIDGDVRPLFGLWETSR
jgi:hypothetical protein